MTVAELLVVGRDFVHQIFPQRQRANRSKLVDQLGLRLHGGYKWKISDLFQFTEVDLEHPAGVDSKRKPRGFGSSKMVNFHFIFE